MSEKTDPYIPLDENADHRRCSICSQLADEERGFQKLHQPEEENTYLPAAASRLQSVTEVWSATQGARQIWQCPECTTCYLYRNEYEFLIGYGGSEDTQTLKRLTAVEAAEWLKDTKPRPPAATNLEADGSTIEQAPILPKEDRSVALSKPESTSVRSVQLDDGSLSVDVSEPEIISVHYVQLDHGIDMGGRLVIERKSVPLISALLHSSLKDHTFRQVECQCGEDAFTVYVAGSDQQPIIGIINRRTEAVLHGGMTGLMMTFPAAEALYAQLLTA